MKRFFILASAAIVALASCAKTEVVYKDAPQEIAFKQVTGPMTKGLTGVNDGTMGVFAQYNNDVPSPAVTNQEYFGNTKFVEKDATTSWHAENTKYWPLEGKLDFTIYAPYNSASGVVVYDYASTPNKLVINVPVNTTDQTDWLYGKNRYCTKSKSDNNLGVDLKHGLSKISVTIASDNTDVFTIQGLSLCNAYQSGKLTITYDDANSYLGTCAASDPANKQDAYQYQELDDASISNTVVTATAKAFEDRLVFPSGNNDRYLVLLYKMSGSEAQLSAKIALNDSWVTGKHYTYAIKMTATEILLTPTVNGWDEGTVAEITGDIAIAEKPTPQP